MAMPAIEKRRWTAAEVRRLIDEHPEPTPRFELVRGELLVTPSPNKMHQRIVHELVRLLDPYVVTHKLGELFFSPSDIDLDPESVLQPDLYVEPGIDGRRPRTTDPVTRLLLAVEVLSPSSARYDRVTKRREYQRDDVPEYWIVDADSQVFERWRPADDRPEILDAEFVWHPDGASEPFRLDVVEFFAAVADDPAV
jgi:Uma2 family endonuclease